MKKIIQAKHLLLSIFQVIIFFLVIIGTAMAQGGNSGSQIFTYTGNFQQFTVPSCVDTITIKVWGAGGGGGGPDCSSVKGGNGGGGACVVSKLAVKLGQSLTILVGSGGGGGTESVIATSAGAGTGGWGDNLFGGGEGGITPGINPAANAAGSGGGGGGASAVFNGAVSAANVMIVAAAGGGGGGGDDESAACNELGGGAAGGGGQDGGFSSSSAFPVGITGASANGNGTQSATSCACGDNGASGGGGGGGGGYLGGTAGGGISARSGDGSACGGGGGSSYSSGVGTTIYNGNRITPGNSSDPDLAGNASGGAGGPGNYVSGVSGGNGIVVISWVDKTPDPVTVCCDTTINKGQSAQVTASTKVGVKSCSWSPVSGLSCTNCASPVASPTVTTTYSVSVTDSDGCTSTQTVTITIVMDTIKKDSIKIKTDTIKNDTVQTKPIEVDCQGNLIYVPNAFSPNGDGWNDVFYVKGNCIYAMDFIVFDRWGNKVFEGQNINEGWNGTYNGKPMNTGTYVYCLAATLQDGTAVSKKGNITLLR